MQCRTTLQFDRQTRVFLSCRRCSHAETGTDSISLLLLQSVTLLTLPNLFDNEFNVDLTINVDSIVSAMLIS